MKNYVVYKHTNKLNGKIYIGITNNIKRRWRNDGVEYKPGKGHQSLFWNAIQKYGWNTFRHEVLKRELTFEEACREEKRIIAITHANDRLIGYNLAKGGNGGLIYDKHPKGMLGKHQTAYEIKVHKELMSDYSRNPMTNGTVKWGVNYGHPKGMLGKHQSLRHRRAMAKQTGSNNPNAKGLRIIFPNGQEEIWPTMKSFIDNGGFYKVYELVKTGKPYYVDLNRVRKKEKAKCSKYLGCIFQRL